MPVRQNGGIIGKLNTPTQSIASGVWGIVEQQLFNKNNSWPAINISYLVISGGGSGGRGTGGNGGGGAGGYSESSLIIASKVAYKITIGAGGSAPASYSLRGNSGSQSSFATISPLGGGGGGIAWFDGNGFGQGTAGLSGGSGGGGAAARNSSGSISRVLNGSGTSGEGSSGGYPASPTVNSVYVGGGGGGASASGGNGTVTASPGTSGAGGNGTSSTITGVSVTRAGGGGGGGSGTAGAGGSGGGGAGSVTSVSATSGTANTGGGGGGGPSASNASGAGGSGVVILKYPNIYTATFSAGVTSSTSTSGDFKITTITAAGASDTVTFN